MTTYACNVTKAAQQRTLAPAEKKEIVDYFEKNPKVLFDPVAKQFMSKFNCSYTSVVKACLEGLTELYPTDE